MQTHHGHLPLYKTRVFLGAVLLVGAVLVALRAVAPTLLLRHVNETLAGMDGYRGRVADVDLAVWRGAYTIEGLRLEKIEGDERRPFLHAPLTDLSLSWRALLFERALVGEIVTRDAELNLVGGESEAAKQLGPENAAYYDRVEALFPFRINRIEIVDATVRYRDPSVKGQDLALTSLYGTVENITNTLDLDDPLPSSALFTAEAFDTGAVRVRADFDPWAGAPTFDLDASARRVPLEALNGYADAYGKLDFEAGRAAVFIELAAAEGKFEGYVKPLLRDVQIADAPGDDPEESWLRKAWELVAGGASEVVENQPLDQVASKIPFAGRFEDPEVGVVQAVANLLVNGFVRALRPTLDDDVDAGDTRRLKAGDGVPDPERGILDTLLGNGSAAKNGTGGLHDDPAGRAGDARRRGQ